MSLDYKLLKELRTTKEFMIAGVATLGILLYFLTLLLLPAYQSYPLYFVFILGGIPLVYDLVLKLSKAEFGSDLLAGIAIVTAILLNEYLAGAVVILMLSGGSALELYAFFRASAVLKALSNRMPSVARLKKDNGFEIVSLEQVKIGDLIEVIPHDICPVDGEVVAGFSNMDESYLTGEPYSMPKAPGSIVLSGAINGEALLLVKAQALAVDSRYQKIVKVIEEQANKQMPMRRLADRIGAWYTPLALAVACLAWYLSGNSDRFLSVLVVATPCPLLIAIPVAIIGAISRCAKYGILIKNPASLEILTSCKTLILDKTGTLTYGKPDLTKIQSFGVSEEEILRLAAALERYSKHPLAEAVVRAAVERHIALPNVEEVSELPGLGLQGRVEGKKISVTGRPKLEKKGYKLAPQLAGMECVVLIEEEIAGIFNFHDIPRADSKKLIDHLASDHGIKNIMILSGDRESEVKYLAEIVGIKDLQGGVSPEQKLERVISENKKYPTVFVGDGINDAPALQAASVGIALGTKSDITSEAADVVIMDQSIAKIDKFFHVASSMRKIALQSAIGGMSLSIVAMFFAAFGFISPLSGALIQEAIDVLAVLNALRVSSGKLD